jgi:putative phosphoribosyl transferase
MQMFRDRGGAGRRLVQRLREQIPGLDGADSAVLGMAPGGVPVAREIALALRAPLDVSVAVRLPAPGYDALGIGGVAAGGIARVDIRTIAMLGVPPEYVAETVRAKCAEVERLTIRYRGGRPPVSLLDRVAIVVDDGAQARFRSRAAVAAARSAGAREVIFAVPVASSDMLDALAEEADAVVCEIVPERHCGIGAYYAEWDPPGVEDLRAMLARMHLTTAAEPPHRRSRVTEPATS